MPSYDDWIRCSAAEQPFVDGNALPMREDDSSKQLSGTTWNVYLYILTARDPVGVREIWRNLAFSSPSLAQYHVNKLLTLDLLHQTVDGKYLVKEKEQIEALRSFVLLRGRLIPRLVFYGALVTGVLVSYLFFRLSRWDFRDLVVISVSVFSLLAFFVEAYSQYCGLKKTVQRI